MENINFNSSMDENSTIGKGLDISDRGNAWTKGNEVSFLAFGDLNIPKTYNDKFDIEINQPKLATINCSTFLESDEVILNFDNNFSTIGTDAAILNFGNNFSTISANENITTGRNLETIIIKGEGSLTIDNSAKSSLGTVNIVFAGNTYTNVEESMNFFVSLAPHLNSSEIPPTLLRTYCKYKSSINSFAPYTSISDSKISLIFNKNYSNTDMLENLQRLDNRIPTNFFGVIGVAHNGFQEQPDNALENVPLELIGKICSFLDPCK